VPKENIAKQPLSATDGVVVQSRKKHLNNHPGLRPPLLSRRGNAGLQVLRPTAVLDYCWPPRPLGAVGVAVGG
jgi:hypothetical protein